MAKQVTIVDYGLGNLFNLQRALNAVGCESALCTDPEKLAKSDRVILPGVGAFGAGIKNLESSGMRDAVISFAKSGRPLMGICLGMQLLMSTSEEHGNWRGLDLISGTVTRFRDPILGAQQFKIPHIGWNTLQIGEARNADWNSSVLKGISEGAAVYYVHSYIVQTKEPQHAVALTNYGRDRFCAVVRRDNVSGCQFHPERSAQVGLQMLSNFVAA